MQDFIHTRPGTPAGRYLRSFWQPVYHGCDLDVGRARPLRVMGEDFVLYRGETGAAHLIEPHCPHRGTLLSTGWVEGDCLRCFYHGWMFDGAGQCVEQPAEDSEFAHKVRIRAYPVREYLGLIFAYLGDGDPPEFPRYPEFENFEGLLEIDSYSRDCNYFQNLENALDMSHVGFVHGDNTASFNGIGRGRDLQAEESDWGVTYTFTRRDGQQRIQQFGMPNIFYMTALPNDPDIGWQESLFWWVPVDDLHHVQFSLHRVPAETEPAARIKARREARRSTIDIAHQDACHDVLSGRLSVRDIDPERVDLVRLQDDIAQIGQGRIARRDNERLGRADVGVIAIRRLWRREMDRQSGGESLTRWHRPEGLTPRVWSLDGSDRGANGAQGEPSVELVDVRPHIEVAQQLALLTGEAAGHERHE